MQKKIILNPPTITPKYLGAADEQDAQINAIRSAEGQFSQDGNTDELVRFWNSLWANGGVKVRGSLMHFRAVDLNLQVGNRDKAWQILNQIAMREEYNDRVCKYRYKIMFDEQKYLGSIEHLVGWYANDAGFDEDHFLQVAKKTLRKIPEAKKEEIDKISRDLLAIGNSDYDLGKLHDKIRAYLEKQGLLK